MPFKYWTEFSTVIRLPFEYQASAYRTSKSSLFRCFHYSDVRYSDFHCREIFKPTKGPVHVQLSTNCVSQLWPRLFCDCGKQSSFYSWLPNTQSFSPKCRDFPGTSITLWTKEKFQKLQKLKVTKLQMTTLKTVI